MARTLVQRFVDDVRVVVRQAKPPTLEEFDAHVADAVHRSDSIRAVMVVLVGDGADVVFDAQLRAKLSRAGLFARPHAILAPAIRPEVVTAMIWIGAKIRSFGPHQLNDACDYLEIGRPVRPAMGEAIASMKLEIGPPSRTAPAVRLGRA